MRVDVCSTTDKLINTDRTQAFGWCERNADVGDATRLPCLLDVYLAMAKQIEKRESYLNNHDFARITGKISPYTVSKYGIHIQWRLK